MQIIPWLNQAVKGNGHLAPLAHLTSMKEEIIMKKAVKCGCVQLDAWFVLLETVIVNFA